ncbi:CapA family protein [Chloroflexota bacterium]
MSKAESEVVMMGCGDVGPVHPPIDGYVELVQPTLATADIRYGNCERQYSERGFYNAFSPHGRQPPYMAKIFTDCGFDVVSLANNHMFDYGEEALLDTRALMIEKGIQVTGAGKDIDEAREPAIVESKGIKVAFLSYCSALPQGRRGIAAPNQIGVAPLRVRTLYDATRSKILTFPNKEDLKTVLDDIAAVRKKADVVVVALHWGILWIPRVLADYQVEVAHAVLDAGADLIFGHHAHVPKAIEVYKGKVCFYDLGNFCFTKGFPGAGWSEPVWSLGSVRSYTEQDPEYPLLPFGKEGKRSLLVKAILSKEGVRQVSFLPIMIDKKYRPEVLLQGDPRFDDAVKFMDWSSEGFNHEFTVEGNEVIIR